jgi:hypothetical protein
MQAIHLNAIVMGRRQRVKEFHPVPERQPLQDFASGGVISRKTTLGQTATPENRI